MAAPSDLNITLGQGTAIKEVYNVKKQNLENNQQFISQHAESQKMKEKPKIKKFDRAVNVEVLGTLTDFLIRSKTDF